MRTGPQITGTRHHTPETVKTPRSGNAARASKFVKWHREAKRIRDKFGQTSEQYRHFIAARPGWAKRIPQ